MIKDKDYIQASSIDFIEYFKHNKPNDKEEKMLLLNYFSPKHTITSEVLATAMGWPNFNSANLKYGTFAGKAAKEMAFTPPIEGFAVSFFTEFNMPESGQDEGHWQWILRPELVEAIHALNWDTEAVKNRMEGELSFADTMLL